MKDRLTKAITHNISTIYGIIWIVITSLRINNNSFWGDEAWTILFSKMGVLEFVKATASDVHPPLYYFIVWIFTQVLGYDAYVYRLVSVVAYVIMVVIAMTYVKKRYGQAASILFITFQSVLSMPVVQNLEARMYSWAILFVFLAFIFLYEIFERNELIYYMFFAISVLCAAYTHYYALVAVAFICASLLIYSIKYRAYFLNSIITLGMIVVLYAPWMIILLRTFRKTKEDYWIKSIPSFVYCIMFIFKSNIFTEIVLCVCLVGAVAFAIYKLSKGSLTSNENEAYLTTINTIWWLVTGIMTIVLTALTGIGVSKIFRPMFQVKYMYPVAAIGWLLLIVGISQLKKPGVAYIILCIFTIITCTMGYRRQINLEKSRHEQVETTLFELDGQIKSNDFILIENDCSTSKLLYHYYPQNENEEVSDTLEYNYSDMQNRDIWILTDSTYDDIKVSEIKELTEKSVELMVQGGMIGRTKVNIYRIY